MDDRPQINSGLVNVNKTEIFGKMKSVFFQYFEPAVDDCCMRIDLEFGLQLVKKNNEKITKQQYTKLLEYLRSVRGEIKQNYLSKVNQVFDDSYKKAVNNPSEQSDFSKVSIIGDDAVKENHAIIQIIRQCEHFFYEELSSLNRQLVLQQGKKNIADSQNPIFPEKLVRTLVDVVKPLKLDVDSRIALYKTFEVNVFSRLGIIYHELIKQFEVAKAATEQLGTMHPYIVDEIKEAAGLFSVTAEQPSAEFSLLQNKLEQWRLAHSPSAYDSIPVTGDVFYEHFEIKHGLHVLQQFNDDVELDEKKLPLKWRVLKKLEELSFSDKVKSLSEHDEDILDLVALIFSEIVLDESLLDVVKMAVLQLEIPLAAASLGQYSVFTSQDNSARQLLDDLFTAGKFLDVDEYEDSLVQERIASTVAKMTKDSGFEYSGWMAESVEFSNYLNKQNQRSHTAEVSTRQLKIDEQVLASNKKMVVMAIENSMKSKTLPTAIVNFLRDVWSDVLLEAYKDEQLEQWRKSVQAMDELIISVMPPANDNERKQILKLLPGLIAELRKGLKQISYDKSAQSRFFKDLAVRHIILMDKKEGTASDMQCSTCWEHKIIAEGIADESAEQVKNLDMESWVAFIIESRKKWGKLSWKDVETETLLFVGKSGVKMLEIEASELAEKLRSGQAAVIKTDKKTITERVLSKLMSV
jgi:hypothetical protein